MQNKIKTVIFDLSEVIIGGYFGIEDLIEHSFGIDKEQFLKRKHETIHLFLDAMRGKLSEDEYITMLLKDTNWNMKSADFKKLFRQKIDATVAGTMQIIKSLKGKVKLILLSDHIKELAEYILKKHKDLQVFDEIIFSYQSGQLKMDNGTFEEILRKFDLNPKETIFVDDSVINVEKAKENGFETILFTDAKELSEQLKLFYLH